MKKQRVTQKSERLPAHLQITPERRAKIEEQQARLRGTANQRGRLSAEARRVQLGAAHETSARAEVEMLASEVRSAKGDEKKEKRQRLARAQSRLAEALAQQGRYDEAAETEPDEEKRTHYAVLWQGVWLDDEKTCPCEGFVDGEIVLTHDHVAEEVVSLKHGGKLMPAVRCNECGFVNVRSLPHELRQLEKARTAAAAVTQGRSGKDLKQNAAQLLRSEDLHDRKVLRSQ